MIINLRSKRTCQRISLTNEPETFITSRNGIDRNMVLDISDVGICYLSNEEVKLGSQLKVTLFLPLEDEHIDAEINIVRCTDITPDRIENKLWAIGSRFVD